MENIEGGATCPVIRTTKRYIKANAYSNFYRVMCSACPGTATNAFKQNTVINKITKKGATYWVERGAKKELVNFVLFLKRMVWYIIIILQLILDRVKKTKNQKLFSFKEIQNKVQVNMKNIKNRLNCTEPKKLDNIN